MKYPSKWRWAFVIFAIAVTVFTVLSHYGIFLPTTSDNIVALNRATSVGVIGGADGPTAIYVTSKTSIFIALLPLWFACTAGFLLFTNKPMYSKICIVLCIASILVSLTVNLQQFAEMSAFLVMGVPMLVSLASCIFTPEILLAVALLIASAYHKKAK